jgi:hypothetical protein
MKINWAAVAVAAFSTLFTHTLSVRLGNGSLSASVGGTPVHLTVNTVLAAAAMAFEGLPASIESGAMTLTYTPDTNPGVTSA